ESPAMLPVIRAIAQAAPSTATVLITGQSGTGKELVARAVHLHGLRSEKPFIAVNCAAIPENLLESELFGHEKGAFTGADRRRIGKFEQCSGGTLFLDEIGDMPPAMQAKLLRVLQEGELERVGGAETIKVDVRVIAATNKDLEKEIARGQFREDLYYRLNVVQLHSPPLRERKEDLPDLTGSFLKEACAKNGKKGMTLSRESLMVLASHDFPGNVRELRNLVERLAILCEGPVVSGPEAENLLPRRSGAPAAVVPQPQPQPMPVAIPPPLPPESAAPSMVSPQPSAPAQAAEPQAPSPRGRVDRPFRDQVEDAEREIILFALNHTKDNVTEAARLLDLERGHFYKKMKSLGLRRGNGTTHLAAPDSAGEAQEESSEA
ncbi:MAG TPA: sigma-54 dependent transcriptional regulator, partial [Myxococcaceae bacterium]|nr:sigma-54 dependent transcriptional regulator [Myxococcaceae bacterium]